MSGALRRAAPRKRPAASRQLMRDLLVEDVAHGHGRSPHPVRLTQRSAETSNRISGIRGAQSTQQLFRRRFSEEPQHLQTKREYLCWTTWSEATNGNSPSITRTRLFSLQTTTPNSMINSYKSRRNWMSLGMHKTIFFACFL